MSPDPPIADLPGEVTFTLDEVAVLLFVADTAVEGRPTAVPSTLGHGGHNGSSRRGCGPIWATSWRRTNRRRSNLDLVNDTTTQLTVPEAARRLGLPGEDVYRLIFRGVLAGQPSENGAVYVSSAAVEEYKAKLAAERVIEA